MFKITMTETDNGSKLYNLFCYYYDENTYSNVVAWSAHNIDEKSLERILQDRKGKESFDLDFGFVLLKSGNGPALFSVSGELYPIPVKREVHIKEASNGGNRISETKTVLSRSGRGKIPC